MEDLFIVPEHLEYLATIQDQACQVSQESESAAPTPDHVYEQIRQTHGVLFEGSASEFSLAVKARNQTIAEATHCSARLAAGLRSARNAYQNLDAQTAKDFDRSIPDKV